MAGDGTAVVRVRAPSLSDGFRFRFVVTRNGLVVAQSAKINISKGTRSQRGGVCPTLRVRPADL